MHCSASLVRGKSFLTLGSLNLSTIFCLFLMVMEPSSLTHWYLQGKEEWRKIEGKEREREEGERRGREREREKERRCSMYAHVPPDSAELFKDIQRLCVVGYQYHLGRGQRGGREGRGGEEEEEGGIHINSPCHQ